MKEGLSLYQSVVLIILGMAVATATSAFAAWTNPTEDPTGGNVTISTGSSVWAENGTDIYYADGDVGVGVTNPDGMLHVGGDTRVGELNNVETAESAGYGSLLYFSGGPDVQGSGSWGSDNSDELWLARYNVAPDTTELRMHLGDDSGQKFVIGNVPWATDVWTPQVVFQSDGDVGIGDTTPDSGLKLDVEGRVGATEYCDEDGNNCTAVEDMGGGASCASQNITWASTSQGNSSNYSNVPWTTTHSSSGSSLCSGTLPSSVHSRLVVVRDGVGTAGLYMAQCINGSWQFIMEKCKRVYSGN